MSTIDSQVVLDFFALLLAGGLLGSVLLIVPLAAGDHLREVLVDAAGLVAVGATMGSLYLSESVGLVPCELCWFQRIVMYPLAVILPLARFRNDRAVVPYALALALIGLMISAYHVQLQLFPDQSSFCEVANPCSNTLAKAFGTFSIPQLSMASFSLVVILMTSALRQTRKDI